MSDEGPGAEVVHQSCADSECNGTMPFIGLGEKDRLPYYKCCVCDRTFVKLAKRFKLVPMRKKL